MNDFRDKTLLTLFPQELSVGQSNKLLERLRDPAFYNLYHSTDPSMTQGMLEKIQKQFEDKIEEEQYIEEGIAFAKEIREGELDKQLLEELETEYINGEDLYALVDRESDSNKEIERIAAIDRIEDIILNTPKQEMTDALSALEIILLQQSPSFQKKLKAKEAKTFKESLD